MKYLCLYLSCCLDNFTINSHSCQTNQAAHSTKYTTSSADEKFLIFFLSNSRGQLRSKQSWKMVLEKYRTKCRIALDAPIDAGNQVFLQLSLCPFLQGPCSHQLSAHPAAWAAAIRLFTRVCKFLTDVQASMNRTDSHSARASI